MFKLRVAAAAALGSVVALFAAGCSKASNPAESGASPSTVQIHHSYAFDVSDQRKLAGFSDHIFVGEVISKTGSTKITKNTPSGQWRVRLIDVIKGDKSSYVTVTQEGGKSEDGTAIIVDDDPILTQGKTYLFAGRYDAATKSVVVVPNYGDVPVTSALDAKVASMKRSAANPKLVPMPR